MSADFRNASDRFNAFRAFDVDLQHDLAQLCKEQARDDKLAEKLEAGRIYGLRQEYYEMKLKRDLARKLKVSDIAEDHW